MNFLLPEDLTEFLRRLDGFIDDSITPLEQRDDNMRFLDHRREYARTDWAGDGTPTQEWLDLLTEVRHLADAAGFYRYQAPVAYGGQAAGNLQMAVVREHLAARGLGLHCDLQSEHAVVGNGVCLLLMDAYGSDAQKAEWCEDLASSDRSFAFAITEPNHGSDATYMETTARRDGDEWVIDGVKTWNSAIHVADTDLVLARTSGQAGDPDGITAFLVPKETPGFTIEKYLWTFNMPAESATVSLSGVRVGDDTVFGGEGRGLRVVQHFFNENRIRQAASSLGAAQYCIDEAIAYARKRQPFGRPLAVNQGVQFPIVELQTQAEMLRAFIRQTAWLMDRDGAFTQSKQVSMCNYWANRLCCQAADQAMQVHGGLGYSRYKPFEHIYRHHRRYRITEGADEIQMRRVAGYLFGFMKSPEPKGVR